MAAQESLTCMYCSQGFSAYHSARRKYCSRACFQAAHPAHPHKKPDSGQCSFCGGATWRKTQSGLCRPCFAHSKAKRTDRICRQCQRPFSIPSWKIPQGKGTFCSRNCVNAYQRTLTGTKSVRWNGGKDRRRGVGWRTARQWALVRANERCERCDAPKKYGDLGVHHIKPYQFCKSDMEANAPNNLLVLCRSCHSKIHRLGEIIHAEHGRFVKGKREVKSGAHRKAEK